MSRFLHVDDCLWRSLSNLATMNKYLQTFPLNLSSSLSNFWSFPSALQLRRQMIKCWGECKFDFWVLWIILSRYLSLIQSINERLIWSFSFQCLTWQPRENQTEMKTFQVKICATFSVFSYFCFLSSPSSSRGIRSMRSYLDWKQNVCAHVEKILKQHK